MKGYIYLSGYSLLVKKMEKLKFYLSTTCRLASERAKKAYLVWAKSML